MTDLRNLKNHREEEEIDRFADAVALIAVALVFSVFIFFCGQSGLMDSLQAEAVVAEVNP